MKVLILRDFKEDARVSMEHYADQLASGLSSYLGKENVSEFSPHITGWLHKLPFSLLMKLRAGRFLLYPRQVRSLKADIFHIVDHGYAHLIKSLASDRTVVTVHDLIPYLAYKKLIKGLSFPSRPYFVEYSLSFLRYANRIITVSENTKKDLVKFFNCDSSRIEVIYNGLDKEFRPLGSEIRKKNRALFGLPYEDCYLILVSGVQVYKNHETSVKVLKNLLSVCAKPVLMIRLGGFCESWNQLVKENELERFVFSPGALSLSKVVELYNCADCLLFPSWYEGFGWPPLEAMACGVPVVTSNVASLPEVVGDAGLMVAPGDVSALTSAVLSVLTQENLRQNFIQKGLARAQNFRSQDAIDKIRSVYDSILEEGPENFVKRNF